MNLPENRKWCSITLSPGLSGEQFFGGDRDCVKELATIFRDRG